MGQVSLLHCTISTFWIVVLFYTKLDIFLRITNFAFKVSKSPRVCSNINSVVLLLSGFQLCLIFSFVRFLSHYSKSF